MFPYRVVAWSILGSVLTWTSQAAAGWIIEQVEKGGGEGSRQQVMLQANRMKTVMFEGGKPTAASILDLNTETITQVDYQDRHYVNGTVQEYVQMFRGMMAGIAKGMQGYPVRTVDRSGSGITTEVVKAENQTIPVSEFQPSPGLTRKTLRETGAQ